MGEIKPEAMSRKKPALGRSKLEERILDLSQGLPSFHDSELHSVALSADQYEWIATMAAILNTTPEIVVMASISLFREFDVPRLSIESLESELGVLSREQALEDAFGTLDGVGKALSEEAQAMHDWVNDLDARTSGTARRWSEARASIQELLNIEAVNGG